MRRFSFALLVLLLLASSAHAEAEIGFYADTEGTGGVLDVPPLVPVDVYLVATGLEDGLRGIEISGTGSLVDANIIVINSDPLFGNPFDLCVDCSCIGWSCIFGTTACVQTTPSDAVVLVHFEFMAFADLGNDLTLCPAGSMPSSIPGGEPGYVDCDQQLIAFADAPNPCSIDMPDGCLVVNPTMACDIVANPVSSFGAVKALLAR